MLDACSELAKMGFALAAQLTLVEIQLLPSITNVKGTAVAE